VKAQKRKRLTALSVVKSEISNPAVY